jgi:hypothetical protein
MTVMITAMKDKKMTPSSKDMEMSVSCSWMAGVECRYGGRAGSQVEPHYQCSFFPWPDGKL